MPSQERMTTELEAVNSMLRAVGDAPVNTISVGAIPADVQIAIDVLREVSRKVQLVGWDFNSESEYALQRDLSGFVTLPGNTLKCDLTEREWDREVVQRGLRLYDKKNHTYVFTKNLECDIVLFLSWDELPEAAREYIKVKAARIYQDGTLGSESLHAYTQQDEIEALMKLTEAEAESLDATIFDHWDIGSIMNRVRPQR